MLMQEESLLIDFFDGYQVNTQRHSLWFICLLISQETKQNHLRELYKVSALTRSSVFFQISFRIDNVRYVIVYLQGKDKWDAL